MTLATGTRAVAGHIAHTVHARPTRPRRPLLLSVHSLPDLLHSRAEFLGHLLDAVGVVRLQRLANSLRLLLNLALYLSRNLLAQVAERLLGVISKAVSHVPRLDKLSSLPVVVGMRFGFAHHPLDLVLRQARTRRDSDTLLLLRRHILRAHIEDTVRVNIERHLNLRDTP